MGKRWLVVIGLMLAASACSGDSSPVDVGAVESEVDVTITTSTELAAESSTTSPTTASPTTILETVTPGPSTIPEELAAELVRDLPEFEATQQDCIRTTELTGDLEISHAPLYELIIACAPTEFSDVLTAEIVSFGLQAPLDDTRCWIFSEPELGASRQVAPLYLALLINDDPIPAASIESVVEVASQCSPGLLLMDNIVLDGPIDEGDEKFVANQALALASDGDCLRNAAMTPAAQAQWLAIFEGFETPSQSIPPNLELQRMMLACISPSAVFEELVGAADVPISDASASCLGNELTNDPFFDIMQQSDRLKAFFDHSPGCFDDEDALVFLDGQVIRILSEDDCRIVRACHEG